MVPHCIQPDRPMPFSFVTCLSSRVAMDCTDSMDAKTFFVLLERPKIALIDSGLR